MAGWRRARLAGTSFGELGIGLACHRGRLPGLRPLPMRSIPRPEIACAACHCAPDRLSFNSCAGHSSRWSDSRPASESFVPLPTLSLWARRTRWAHGQMSAAVFQDGRAYRARRRQGRLRRVISPPDSGTVKGRRCNLHPWSNFPALSRFSPPPRCF